MGKTEGNISNSSLTVQSEKANISLMDVSPKDMPWDKHRSFADLVEFYYADSKFDQYSNRISFCSQLLEFGLIADLDNSLRLKLKSARFCRVRHCPICQWRKSLVWQAKSHKILPKVLENYPSHRWLFVTLTIKNCDILNLRDTLIYLNQSFQRLSQRKNFPAVGWVRSTEVTKSVDGTAHPHFHCLLMVPASYYSHGYLKQNQWVSIWQSCLRVDYSPVIDIRSIKKSENVSYALSEIIKYSVKESDLVKDRDWFLELTEQLHNMRLISTGGILKNHLKELENDPNDLINTDLDDIKTGEDYGRLIFEWRSYVKKYLLQ